MLFKKEFLLDLLWFEVENAEIIINEIFDKRRWSIKHRIIFKFNDKFYESTYWEGSTELQDERPYEYEPDEIECPEVIPVEKKVIVYEHINTKTDNRIYD